MSRITSLSEWLLRQPVVWGGLACLAYYALIRQGVITNATVLRYTDSHQVEYVTIALFFVGLAALIMRLLALTAQFASFQRELIEPIPVGGQSVADAERLLADLALLPEYIRRGYLVNRLAQALEYIRRKDSADQLEPQLRHLEEADAISMSGGYAMVRIIVWAIPILGFLGTVIGITLAIAQLSPDALEHSLPEVTSKLGLAFDTTALALALSIVLMFVKFCVERVEDRLLTKVDARVAEELVGRFQQTGTSGDPNVATVRVMGEQVVQAVEAMAARQAQVWKSTIDETHEQWAHATASAGEVLEHALSSAVQENCDRHAQALTDGARAHIDNLAEATMHVVDQLQRAGEQHARHLATNANETVGRLREGLQNLAELLVEALEHHGEKLTAGELELAEVNRRHLAEVEAVLGEAMALSADRQETLIERSEQLLKEMQAALANSAGATVEQQAQLVKQGEVLLKVVDATGQVRRLEESLNNNLATLSRTQSLEETLLSLSAAIQLLSAKAGGSSPQSATVDLGYDEPSSNAA